MKIQPKHIIKSERAQSTAEFVAVIPFLLLLFFLMVDFGWLFKNYIVVTNSGREATRCAVVGTCDPEVLAQERLNNGGLAALSSTIDVFYSEEQAPAGINKGDSVIVCIETQNQYISPVLPFLSMVSGGSLPNPIPLRSQTEMRVERVVPGQNDSFPAWGGSCNFS